MISVWKNILLQDSNSYVMENLIIFHDYVIIFILMILFYILYLMIFMIFNNFVNRFMYESQMIELIWTLIPMFLLLLLVFPSLKILYLIDEIFYPLITVKVVGHQWYWSYEFDDEFLNMNFDSFMLNFNKNEFMMFRLLDVDNRLILPCLLNIRMIITSMDVIHSFALPSLGIKVDAIPGRLNQIGLMLNRPGLFFGQCSEICGINHSFMPIVVESTNLHFFLNLFI